MLLLANWALAHLILDADLAPGHSRQQAARLQCGHVRSLELLVVVHSDEPEAVLSVIVMAVSLATVALDERRRPEVLQARARAGQLLATASVADSRVLLLWGK